MQKISTQKTFEDVHINVKLKLALLWVSFMFLYIYVDYFHLYMSGTIESIMKGKVYVFDINQGFVFTALSLASIPILMIFFSVALPAKVNRFINILFAGLHIPYMLFNLAGEAWGHMYFAAALEVVLLCLVIRYAWKWPCVAS